MNELALFAGAGGGILGGKLLGWRTVCAVEIDPYARQVLIARQRDGILEPFPIWDDVTTFDGYPWRGQVEVVSGGFPCTDISSAGRGEGITGEHSSLWAEMFRIVQEVQPSFVWIENSPLLVSRGLDRVLDDLASLGTYEAVWGVIGADDLGFSHRRKRIWVLAHAQGQGLAQRGDRSPEGEGPDRASAQPGRDRLAGCSMSSALASWVDGPPESVLLGKTHGMAARVDRHRAIGNGQIPVVDATAFGILRSHLTQN